MSFILQEEYGAEPDNIILYPLTQRIAGFLFSFFMSLTGANLLDARAAQRTANEATSRIFCSKGQQGVYYVQKESDKEEDSEEKDN